jgi:hypothetical protein
MKRMMLAAIALTAALACVSKPALANHTPDRLVFDGNVLWNNMQTPPTQLPWSAASGACTTSTAPIVSFTYSVTQLGTTHFTHNKTTLDPKLVDPYNLTNPNWTPQLLSPLLCKYTTDGVVMNVTGLDPFFQQTDYIGAVPLPSLTNPQPAWYGGWTYFNTAGGLGRTDINYSKPVVVLQGPQAASMVLSNTNNYLIRGKVNFLSGTTLTIPAGTYLFGEKATTGFLVIERGARIVVNGTAAAPVVLTSDQDPSVGAMAPGDNGGVVLHGRAIANCANTAAGEDCVSEGGAGLFGGGDDADDSGIIRYMRIEYSGKELSVDNELNSLTMNAVGTGTTIEFVQACLGSDDSFEWFGGTGRARYLVATGADDDGLDWQLGWRGAVQFAIVQQYPLRGDKGIEADNSEFNFDASPRSNPRLANLTLVGTNPPTAGAGSSNRGIHLRRGTAGAIVNSVILGFRGPGLDLSDPETFGNCPATALPGNPAPPAVFCQGTATAVEAEPVPLRHGLIFANASPNPLAASTKILVGLGADAQNVKARIFDAQGRLVETLSQGPMTKGLHTITWTPSGKIPTGHYFFKIEDEKGQSTGGKLVLVR